MSRIEKVLNYILLLLCGILIGKGIMLAVYRYPHKKPPQEGKVKQTTYFSTYSSAVRVLTASWYPMTGKYSKRIPAYPYHRGEKKRVKDYPFGCAYNYASLGSWVIIYCPQTQRIATAQVIDRIGEKEYADRIDLNAWLFEALGLPLWKGLAEVYVMPVEGVMGS